jgi:hypothetical protein
MEGWFEHAEKILRRLTSKERGKRVRVSGPPSGRPQAREKSGVELRPISGLMELVKAGDSGRLRRPLIELS